MDDQFELGIPIAIDAPCTLAELPPGAWFLQEGTGLRGRIVALRKGTVDVAVRVEDRMTRTTWAPATVVRRVRG